MGKLLSEEAAAEEQRRADELAANIAPALDQVRHDAGADLRDAGDQGDDIEAWLVLIGLAGLGGVRRIVLAVTPDWAATQAAHALVSVGGDLQAEAAKSLDRRAAAWARERAAELVTQIEETTRDRLREAITDGVAQGLDAEGLAALIESDASGLFDAARAATIARTELAFARGQGALLGYRIAEEIGIAVTKTWEVDGDPCVVCVENNAAGPIGLDEAFPSGDLATPAHPNCQCHLGGVAA